jgi:hypothetical protein
MIVATYLAWPTENRGASGQEPDPAVLRDLQEIVQIRERLAATHEVLLAAGRAADDGRAAIGLAEARIDLAREQGQTDQVLAELQRIVSLQEARLARAEARSTEGVSPIIRDEIRVEVLQARIRLARERALPH